MGCTDEMGVWRIERARLSTFNQRPAKMGGRPRIQSMLGLEHPGRKTLGRVSVQHRDRPLGED